MKGIIINPADGDLLITNRHLTVAPCEQDIAERVLLTIRGEMKETPLIGAELTLLAGAGHDPFLAGRIRDMLRAAHIDCTSVSINPDGIITIK